MADEGFLKISFEDNCNDVERKRILPFANSDTFKTKIVYATKLTHDEEVKDIYDISLDIKDIRYDFLPGDTIGILPNNNLNEINKIFECLDCTELIDKKCTISLLDPKKGKFVAHLPVHTTLRDIFLKHVDIRSPPKKKFLKILTTFTDNREEKNVLERLSSQSNSEEYITFISETGRTLVGLLQTFPSCNVPIERIIENLPPLQPRPYSISSSPLIKNELHITFSVEYFDKEIKGVCSGWLEDVLLLSEDKTLAIKDKDYINFYFRKPNNFRLNINTCSPVIMIGPGTGVAPFIGFLQHLYLEKKCLETWLFYGCRYKSKDYLYKDDLEKYFQENYLKKLFVAFSRDQDIKVYVQDLIKNEPAQIYNKLINEDATVYVCGDIKDMMKMVKDAIQYCLVKNGMSTDKAGIFISEMVKANKYVEDKWI